MILQKNESKTVHKDTILRYTYLLITAVFLLFPTTIFAQGSKVSLSAKNASLKEVLTDIEAKTTVRFSYIDEDIKSPKDITFVKEFPNVETLLNWLLPPRNLEFIRTGNTIAIKKKQPGHKNRELTGIVTDEKGDPIIGANVVEKGTTNGTVTDINGTFSLTVQGRNVLTVSYIGYISQDIPINNASTLNIRLKEDSEQLEEVIVVGYGSIKRVNVSGAISSVDSKIFESRPIQNAAAALQGEIPGVTITRNSGTPGGDTNIRIRDISSINGGEPLILIDGAEGTLSDINPSDIENISVLKDGNAAIYGARAADGVILVTTKSGKRNQPLKVSVDAYYALKKPALMKETVNLYQYAEMGLEITDGSWTSEYTAEDLPKIAANSPEIVPNGIWGMYPKFYQYVDKKKEIIGNGGQRYYNINMAGGGEKYSYLLSLGYQQEQGLPKFGKDKDNRYYVRAKTDIDLLKNLNLDLNLAYETSDRSYSAAIDGRDGIIRNIWEGLSFWGRVWAPLYNPEGNYYTFQYYHNPAQSLEELGDKNNTRTNFTFNSKLTWKVLEGLNITGQAIIRKNDKDENAFYKVVDTYDWDNNITWIYGNPNYASRRYEKTLYKNFTVLADFKRRFNEIHDLGIMIGGANESSNYDWFEAARQDFSQQEVPSLNLGSPENQYATSGGEAWTINSYFARLNYVLMDKYIVEANFRADASSRFHPDYRWGYFPGVSVAWRLNEEKFIKDLNIFDNLKIRGSYGEMGNQSGIGLYDYIPLISISNSYYPFGKGNRASLSYVNSMVSLTRSWETVATYDIGADLGFLNNRLTASADFFKKINNNMLIPVTYPSILGADAPMTNNGRLEIKGWELTLGWQDKLGDFGYSIKASISDARNLVVEKGGSDAYTLGLNKTRKGYPLNSYFGYEFDGIIQNEQELEAYKAQFAKGGVPGNLRVGDAKYKDLNKDGKLSLFGDDGNDGDAKYLGDMNPRYNFGLNVSCNYKGFDFSFFLQGVGKRTLFLEAEASRPFYQWWFDPLEYWYGKTWTEERTSAQYPAITVDQTRAGYNYATSDNTRFNAAYMRMKNMQLGYSLPQNLLKKVHLEKVRFYISGEDLFEIHNVPGGYDPENTGYYGSYPFTRMFSFGTNIIF